MFFYKKVNFLTNFIAVLTPLLLLWRDDIKLSVKMGLGIYSYKLLNFNSETERQPC